MAVWRTFFLNLTLLGRMLQPAADNKGCLARFKFLQNRAKRPLHLQQADTLDQIIQENNLQRAGHERHKVSKGTLRPDFQTNTKPMILF
jgi:hypothetical protein